MGLERYVVLVDLSSHNANTLVIEGKAIRVSRRDG